MGIIKKRMELIIPAIKASLLEYGREVLDIENPTFTTVLSEMYLEATTSSGETLFDLVLAYINNPDIELYIQSIEGFAYRARLKPSDSGIVLHTVDGRTFMLSDYHRAWSIINYVQK